MSDQPVVSEKLAPGQAVQASPKASSELQDRRLSTILEIAKVLISESDPEAMLHKSLAHLVKKVEAAQSGILLLYDPPSERLKVRAACGYDLNLLRPVQLLPGESISGKVFQNGQAQLYPTPEAIAAGKANLSPKNQEFLETAASERAQPQSALCMPLIAAEENLGVLQLENRHQRDSFTQQDLTLLHTVVELMALALQSDRLNKDLENARILEEANRLKAELISTLAHEMRTPLTSIKGYSTALLMEEATFGPESQREFLGIIDQECDVLQDLIHDLLESSIIDAGLLQLELQPVRLPQVTQSVIGDIAHHTQIHRFLVDFPANFPLVDADPRRIAQVLRNLLDNAVKYSPQGGLIAVRGEVHADEVVISVADQGVGLAPEHINRLFEKFFRVKSGLGPHVGGSGLGLPISLAIVESHGGRIWAKSQVGQGTTLYFTLPRKGLSQEIDQQEAQQDE